MTIFFDHFLLFTSHTLFLNNFYIKDKKKNKSKAFNSKFIRAVDEFYDRLTKFDNTVQISSSNSFWNLGSVLNVISQSNLNDFVDGGIAHPPAHSMSSVSSVLPSLPPSLPPSIPGSGSGPGHSLSTMPPAAAVPYYDEAFSAKTSTNRNYPDG